MTDSKFNLRTGLTLAGLAATVLSGLTCALPFAAVVLGIGGVGWLTRYSHFNLPLTLVAAASLLAAFCLTYRRQRGCGANAKTRLLLWTTVTLMVAFNVFEHLVLPRL